MDNDALDTTDQKETFALHMLLRHNDAAAAAKAVSVDLGYCLFIATHWPDDLYVMQHKQKLLNEHGAAFFLPSKFDIAHRVVAAADRTLITDDKIKALKLYAELMNFIEKPGMVQSNVTNITQNRVMVVPQHGNDDEWQQQLLDSQRKLVANA